MFRSSERPKTLKTDSPVGIQSCGLMRPEAAGIAGGKRRSKEDGAGFTQVFQALDWDLTSASRPRVPLEPRRRLQRPRVCREMSLTGNLREEGSCAFSGARLVPEIGNSASRTPGPRPQTAKTENLPGYGLNGEAHCRHCIVSLSDSGHESDFGCCPVAKRRTSWTSMMLSMKDETCQCSGFSEAESPEISCREGKEN